MSEIVTTTLGRFRCVTDGKDKWPLWECPKCQSWCGFSEAQWEGRSSVICLGPSGDKTCNYHETHPFGKILFKTIQLRILMGESPTDPEDSVK